jgi:hypothetical protein
MTLSPGSEDSSVSLNHRFYNIAIDLPGALVRLDADLVEAGIKLSSLRH